MSWGLLALAQKLQGLKTISQGDNHIHIHGFTLLNLHNTV